MKVNKLFNGVGKIQGRFSPNELHSAEPFRMIMEREVARADRTGVIFSLVVFEVADEKGDAASPSRVFSDLIRNRARSVDEVGWIDERSLAALLHGTPAEGARRFVENLMKVIRPDAPLPPWRVYTYPATHSSDGRDLPFGKQLDLPIISDESIKAVLARRMPRWKRGIDILGALAGLILLSPLFLLLAIFIKAVSPGPVFFKQKRVGHMGKTFTFWKFRTMEPDNDATIHRRYLSQLIHGDDAMIKLDDERDSRIIPFGKILRKSSLDELPQLINVLFGEMSLVGPRPCLPYEAMHYLIWHTRRFDTVPGMTGLWQVSGKNKTTFKEMIRLDITYSKKVSLWLDVKILLKTIPAIFSEIADKRADESK